MEEIYKDIKEYEGLYQVSNQGRVKSLERPHNFIGIRKEKILQLRINRDGYIQIDLYNFGKVKTTTIHRLVASHFFRKSRKQTRN